MWNQIVSCAAGVAVTVMLVGCRADKAMVESSAAGDISLSVSQLANARAGTISNQAEMPLEPVDLFYGNFPTGVAVSHENRIFVNFPRWGDPVQYCLAEVRGGQLVPYPDEQVTRLDTDNPHDSFISPQSVVIDGHNHLWVLDPGSINFAPVIADAPKLVEIDLTTASILKTIPFPPQVCLPTSFLNDVRFDLGKGTGGVAYITDSSDTGPNGIIVVDLASEKSWRRLSDHPSTRAEPHFVATVEGEPFMARPGGGKPDAYVRVGADGIALTPDGRTLYYCPMSGHHLHSVDAGLLADPAKTDADVAASVKDLGDRGFASDGLLCDNTGTLYLTDYEHNAIRTRTPDGQYHVLVSDPRLIWPDSMSIGGDGYLYVTANQLNRQKAYTGGKDLRKQPYALFRVNVHAKPSMPGAGGM
jgi:sugar lactone lactonase YvrE